MPAGLTVWDLKEKKNPKITTSLFDGNSNYKANKRPKSTYTQTPDRIPIKVDRYNKQDELKTLGFID